MDFLTQPFSRAAAPPRSAPAPPPAPSPPSTSSSPSVPVVHHRHPDDETTSVVSASTEGVDDRFAQLRTAPPPMGPVPGEAILPVPSTKAGDWLAYGRVSAHVVLWDDGTVGESKKLRDEVIKEEWIVEGTLSLTKDDQILLILDRDVPPLPVLVGGPSKSSRRLSFGRRKSLTPGSSEATSATSETASPCRSLDDASPTSRGREHEQEEQSDPWQTEGGFSERGSSSGRGGFGGFVKKIVGAVRSTSRGRTKYLEQPQQQQQSDDGTGLGLTRTITGGSGGRRRAVSAAATEVSCPVGTGEQKREQGQRTESSPSDYVSRPEALQLKFDEPAAIDKNPSPFPTYKNHPITALCISSPSYIHALRFYPQRTLSPVAASESGLYSFPFLFGPATSRDAPISSSPGSPSLCSYPGSIAVQPPVVELDVAVPGRYLEAGPPQARDEGRKREVTVGFVFKEVMMATEADDFKSRLEGKLGGAPLRRVGSGSSGEKGQGGTPGVAQRRKSWAFSSG
ncbi:hypothetical protein JCM5296_003680 [Sporobolomyces johnsonii]